MSEAGNKKIARRHISHRKGEGRNERLIRIERRRLREEEPDDWTDAENERLTDQLHEPIARDEA